MPRGLAIALSLLFTAGVLGVLALLVIQSVAQFTDRAGTCVAARYHARSYPPACILPRLVPFDPVEESSFDEVQPSADVVARCSLV